MKKKPRWTKQQTDYLIAHWPDSGSKLVGEVLGKPWRNVQRKAIRMKLKCNQQARFVRVAEKIAASNTSCDIDYFDKDWSPNLAYIVGYIYADGCITKKMDTLAFLCHTKDEEILLAIQKELRSTHKIARRPAQRTGNRNNGPRTILNITSTRIVDSLMNRFGLRPRKTYLNLPMPKIPDAYFGHFLRGYFDGDGHIRKRDECAGGSFTFVGTKRFIWQMRINVCRLLHVLRTKLGRYVGKKTGKVVYSAIWGGHEDLKAIYNMMYPKGESYIFLARKHKVFKEVVEQDVARIQNVRKRNRKVGG